MGGDEKEVVIYSGRPSQAVNYNTYLFCILLFIAAVFAPTIWNKFLSVQYAQYKNIYMLASKALFFIPIIMAFSAWIKVHSHHYIITNERLNETEGVLSKITHELELFRVKDISYVAPFFLRMCGCGNIILDTSDRSTPIVVLHAIKDARPVMDLVRKNVQIMRVKKGVREFDH
jgi:uncharacterized membrane protein YdbT with pleckstrin-like domain